MTFQQSRVTVSNPFLHRAIDVSDSLYESFNPLNVVAKQHFVEWFSGNALDSIWTTLDAGGTGTFQMEDSIDGGFSVQCGSVDGDFSAIAFNNINHFDPVNCVIIMITKDFVTTNGDERSGMSRVANEEGAGTDQTFWRSVVGDTNFSFLTGNTANTVINGSVARDTNWHTVKIKLISSSLAEMDIDGVLDVSITTNIPNEKMQPRIATRQNTSSGKVGIRYYEAFNT